MPSIESRQNGSDPEAAAPRPGAGAGRQRPEPLPLGPAYAATGARRPTGGAREIWSEVLFDRELAGLVGVLIALCLWFAVMAPGGADRDAARPASPADGVVSLAEVAPDPMAPAASFAFVSARGRHWLLPAILAASPKAGPPPPPPGADRDATPLVTAAVERHALVAEPAFDPLGTVTVSGLPADTHLSAGAALSPTGHAIAFGDLDNLVIRLPARRTTPIRTTLDLRTRTGIKIHTFSVEIREESGADAGGEPPPPKRTVKKPKLAPVKAVKPPKKVLRKPVTGAAAITPAAAVVKAPAAPAPPPVAAAPPAVGPLGLPALPPLGIFKPDPKDSALNGLTPDLRDDPRFTTLRGLGLRPDPLPTPAPAPPPATPGSPPGAP